MPRIRTLKPEALQHRKVGRLSDRAFRLWVACITQADDDGRLVFDADQFRVLVWGYHAKVRPDDVLRGLAELLSTGLVRGYVDNSGTVTYLDLPSWNDHQRVDHKSKSRLPAFAETELEGFSRALARAREASRALYRDRKDRKEGKGKDRKEQHESDQTRNLLSNDSTGDDGSPRARPQAGSNRSGPLAGTLANLMGALESRRRELVPGDHAEV